MAKKPAKEQDEVWGRRVRELGSSLFNRHCFECEQRGVTYIDITVGSFVCTSCSGLLRGLNPPHRVKSISMTTFTEQEVNFLQTRGNEVCRKIWLGLCDSRTSVVPDSRDPQKVKEFLQEKYEKKRWYVSPDQVKAGPAKISLGSGQSAPSEGKPLRSVLEESQSAGGPHGQMGSQSQARLQQHRSSQQQQPPPLTVSKKASLDLLADIGGDPFAAPQPAQQVFGAFPAFGGHAAAHFANFDAFAGPATSAFGGSTVTAATQVSFPPHANTTGSRSIGNSYSFGGASVTAPSSHPTTFASFPKSSSTGLGVFEAPLQTNPAAADKYMPLADLGSAFSSATGSSQVTTGFSNTTSKDPGSYPSGISDFGSVFSPGNSSVFGTVGQVTSLPAASTGTSYGAFTNPFAAATVSQQSLPSTNPFQTNGTVPGFSYGTSNVPGFAAVTGGFHHTLQQQPQQVFAQQSAFSQQHNGTSFSSGFPVDKPPQRPLGQAVGVSTNPFMPSTAPGSFATRATVTNPFL
ncbi:arf-GAP domain and FG repeat-containing protein 2 isoform X1 [Microcaecilia unicolor]|uniref:Arf-GAP domain and FG repeat-containing protein 2 isoform X1 n=1 Tax=Microcaecilia unicolor TaxID=1415580 RepID=A0A6P7WZ04_9AMPH|nr:arf-GAP domain and FG repeat-containing protein 2 isoform X1 [Microcaecilia unicolor]